MQFLKTLFWVALAVALVVFSANNWEPVSIGLWGGLRMDTKLPVLVIGAFLVGFLPLYLVHRTVVWRMRRRIATLEAANRPAATGYDAGPDRTVEERDAPVPHERYPADRPGPAPL